jgi:hypothetical protein
MPIADVCSRMLSRMLTHANVCLSQTLAQVRRHKAEMQAQIAELEAQVLTLLVYRYKSTNVDMQARRLPSSRRWYSLYLLYRYKKYKC